MTQRLVLLYDGLCGFCNGTVRFILARDAGGAMRFATLQGDFAKSILARHPSVAGIDSLVVVEFDDAGEHIMVRSDAALRIASHLGGPWRLFLGLRLVPRPLRDLAYSAFARFRYRLFGRYGACPLPPPGTRDRFMD